MGGPVAHSRSHELKGATVCSYASANGRTVNGRLRKSADDIAVKQATSDKSVQAGGWTGYQAREVVTIVEDKKLLEVDFYYSVDESADLAATDHVLAGAVADALLDT